MFIHNPPQLPGPNTTSDRDFHSLQGGSCPHPPGQLRYNANLRVEAFRRDLTPKRMSCIDPLLDRLADVRNGLFLRAALRYAAGQAGNLCHPTAVFTGMENDLTHV